MMYLEQKYFCTQSKAASLTTDLIRCANPSFRLYEHWISARGFEETSVKLLIGSFILLSGQKVAKHKDSGFGITPLLILRNPNNEWSFKGPRQTKKSVGCPNPGEIVFLNTDLLHEVAGRSSYDSSNSWIAFSWTPTKCFELKEQGKDLQEVSDLFHEDLGRVMSEVCR